mgnify:CR=1 FL=1
MKNLMRSLVLVAALVVATQAWAWGGVRISWTDSEGPKYVDLTLVPATPSDPFYVGMDAVWFGTLDMVMDTLGPITLTASGSYDGVYPGGYYDTWFQVVLEQNITNNTGQSWVGFDLGINGAYFGWPHKTNNWNVVQNDTSVSFTYSGGGGAAVAPGGIFHDGISIFDPDGLPDPTADFTLLKWATPIPEASGLAAVLAGMGGMLSLVRRRKA